MTDPATLKLVDNIGAARGTDYFLMKEQLTKDEVELLHKVRKFGEEEVLPVVNPYWERGEFPFDLVPKIAALNIVGDNNMRDYGCRPMSTVGAGLISMELSRVDGSFATFFCVHVGLGMQSINILGSEEQKRRWLPPMARMEKIGAFALTEPDHGSDSVALEATARRDGDEWVLNGRKRWPGNAVWCDVIIVYARDVADKQVKAFIVEKGNPGYKAVAAYDIALNYAQRRIQFGKPIAKTQMIQSMLVEMLGDVTAMQLYCIRMGRLIDEGKAEDTMAALAKYYCTVKARDVCRLARDILGGNGITLEFHVMRHLCDMEALVTYEGTAEVQSLIVGRHITGHSAFA